MLVVLLNILLEVGNVIQMLVPLCSCSHIGGVYPDILILDVIISAVELTRTNGFP